MARKEEKDKVRFVKVIVPTRLGKQVNRAYISAKFPTLDDATTSTERGRIMTPLEAYTFMKKNNVKFETAE